MPFAECVHGWIRMIMFGDLPFACIENPIYREAIRWKPIRSKLFGDIFANFVTLCWQRLQGVYIKPLICVLMIGMQETVSKSAGASNVLNGRRKNLTCNISN
jgi:hypothetical protein